MKTIDLRDELPRPKYSVLKETTLHVNGKYVGFRHVGLGVGFVRKTQAGLTELRSGRVRWYHTIESTLIDAVRYVRKTYGLKMPVNGWETFRVKHFNNSTATEIIDALEQSI